MCSLVYTSYCFGAEGGFSGREGMGVLPGPVSGTVGGRWGVLGTIGKNGVFLIVPKQQNSVNAAGTPHTAAFGRLRSSDKPLRATGFCRFEAIRNISVFSNGAEKSPHVPQPPRSVCRARKQKQTAAPLGRRYEGQGQRN